MYSLHPCLILTTTSVVVICWFISCIEFNDRFPGWQAKYFLLCILYRQVFFFLHTLGPMYCDGQSNARLYEWSYKLPLKGLDLDCVFFLLLHVFKMCHKGLRQRREEGSSNPRLFMRRCSKDESVTSSHQPTLFYFEGLVRCGRYYFFRGWGRLLSRTHWLENAFPQV